MIDLKPDLTDPSTTQHVITIAVCLGLVSSKRLEATPPWKSFEAWKRAELLETQTLPHNQMRLNLARAGPLTGCLPPSLNDPNVYTGRTTMMDSIDTPTATHRLGETPHRREPTACQRTSSRRSRAVACCAAWWQSLLTRRARKRAVEMICTLDAHMLHDIGVSDAMVQECEARRKLNEHNLTPWQWS